MLKVYFLKYKEEYDFNISVMTRIINYLLITTIDASKGDLIIFAHPNSELNSVIKDKYMKNKIQIDYPLIFIYDGDFIRHVNRKIPDDIKEDFPSNYWDSMIRY